MKKSIGLFFLIVCLNQLTFAQTSKLFLINNKKSDTIQIFENTKVDLQLIDAKSLKGRINILNDSCIKLGDSLIQLDKISKIGFLNKSNKLIGKSLISIGGVLIASVLIYNLHAITQSDDKKDLSRLIVNIGCLPIITPILGIGLSKRFIYSYYYIDTETNRSKKIDPIYKIIIKIN
jgi:hypothetical protein